MTDMTLDEILNRMVQDCIDEKEQKKNNSGSDDTALQKEHCSFWYWVIAWSRKANEKGMMIT